MTSEAVGLAYVEVEVDYICKNLKSQNKPD